MYNMETKIFFTRPLVILKESDSSAHSLVAYSTSDWSVESRRTPDGPYEMEVVVTQRRHMLYINLYLLTLKLLWYTNPSKNV